MAAYELRKCALQEQILCRDNRVVVVDFVPLITSSGAAASDSSIRLSCALKFGKAPVALQSQLLAGPLDLLKCGLGCGLET